MKILISTITIALILLTANISSVFAVEAGECTVTPMQGPRGVRYDIAWVSDASGDVSDACTITLTGQPRTIQFLSASLLSPTADYDVKLLDSASNDILDGIGQNIPEFDTGDEDQDTWYRSVLNADGAYYEFINETFTPKVENAGDSKAGTIRIKTRW